MFAKGLVINNCTKTKMPDFKNTIKLGKILEQKGNIQMASNCTEKCSILLVIKEIQNKTK